MLVPLITGYLVYDEYFTLKSINHLLILEICTVFVKFALLKRIKVKYVAFLYSGIKAEIML